MNGFPWLQAFTRPACIRCRVVQTEVFYCIGYLQAVCPACLVADTDKVSNTYRVVNRRKNKQRR